jgi:ABC-type Fe3+/spermidine/putrescine transport system ATPase subunit
VSLLRSETLSDHGAEPVPTDAGRAAMSLAGISKTYHGSRQPAVDGLDLDIRHGEFVTLLGPSGCGKSSTLRIVAGLEEADRGTIHFGDRVIVDAARGYAVKPDKRGLGMVFQAYAIWPNMTVAQNVAFPLKAKHMPRNKIRPKVEEALALVGMSGYEDRPAPMLSGGQQQRVALARAIVTGPDLLLLDEPFSNLDAKLREQLRVEMKQLQRQLDIAVLFVTHDQIEALALSDRIAVMRAGVIQQQGKPNELYEEPATEFVRDFIGSTIMFAGTTRSASSPKTADVALAGTADCVVTGTPRGGVAFGADQPVQVAVRPEDIAVIAATTGARPRHSLEGRVLTALFVGERVEYQVEVAGHGKIVVYSPRRDRVDADTDVFVIPQPDGHSVWPSDTQQKRTG